MKSQSLLVLVVLILPSFLATLSAAKEDFDFFYFVLQVRLPTRFSSCKRFCNDLLYVVLNLFCWICSGQDPIVTPGGAVVIRRQGNLLQTSAFMDSGLTTMMAHGRRTVILIAGTMNPRYPFFLLLFFIY